jgi:hypothetical protein
VRQGVIDRRTVITYLSDRDGVDSSGTEKIQGININAIGKMCTLEGNG